MKKHFKSDFELTLPIRGVDGAEALSPEFDWTAKFWTSSAAISFVAKKRGGVLTNAYEDEGGRTHVVFDRHGLPAGRLRGELTCEFEDTTYPDGYRQEVSKISTDLELTKDGNDIGEVEVAIFGALLDKVNAILAGALDVAPGVVLTSSGGGSATLQRGMISIGAKPGVVYRNLGYIKVPLRGEGDFDVDLSGIDLTWITGVSVANGCNDTVGKSYIDYESKKLIVRGLRRNKTESVRLCVNRDEDWQRDYIMRDTDGLIRPIYLPYKPAEYTPQAPKMGKLHSKGINIYKYLSACCDGRGYDLQMKRRSNGRVNTKSKWRKWKSSAKRGVGRIRFSGNGRRKPSAWTVFTFYIDDQNRLSIEPLT